jgi:hypothetical protein
MGARFTWQLKTDMKTDTRTSASGPKAQLGRRTARSIRLTTAVGRADQKARVLRHRALRVAEEVVAPDRQQ